MIWRDWCGVCCKGQCWRVGEDHKGGKKQGDEERGGGIFPERGWEEEVVRPIRRWEEEIDRFFFSGLFK